jgi:hypothetical protein
VFVALRICYCGSSAPSDERAFSWVGGFSSPVSLETKTEYYLVSIHICLMLVHRCRRHESTHTNMFHVCWQTSKTHFDNNKNEWCCCCGGTARRQSLVKRSAVTFVKKAGRGCTGMKDGTGVGGAGRALERRMNRIHCRPLESTRTRFYHLQAVVARYGTPPAGGQLYSTQ